MAEDTTGPAPAAAPSFGRDADPVVRTFRKPEGRGPVLEPRLPTLRALAGGAAAGGTPAAARPRPASPPVPPPAYAAAATAIPALEPGAGWWRRIPARLWFAAVVMAAPFRALMMVLDALVAAAVLAVIGVGWAWWTQRITDDQVAGVLGQIGARGLAILSKSGVL